MANVSSEDSSVELIAESEKKLSALIESQLEKAFGWIRMNVFSQNMTGLDSDRLKDYHKHVKTLEIHHRLGLVSDEYELPQKIKDLHRESKQQCLNLLGVMEAYDGFKKENKEVEDIQSLSSIKNQFEGIQKVMGFEDELVVPYEQSKSTIRSNLKKGMSQVASVIKELRKGRMEDMEGVIEKMAEQIWFIEESSKVFNTEDAGNLKNNFVEEFNRLLSREARDIGNERMIVISSKMTTVSLEKTARVFNKIMVFEGLKANLPELEQPLADIRATIIERILQPLKSKDQIVSKITQKGVEFNLLNFEAICTYVMHLSMLQIGFERITELSNSDFWIKMTKGFTELIDSLDKELKRYTETAEEEEEDNNS